MKTVTINCDNGANIHSKRSETVPLDQLGFTDVEWEALDDDKKQEAAFKWVMESDWIQIWHEENE